MAEESSNMDAVSIVQELDALIDEAIDSGRNQRVREYSGFDFTIYIFRIEPLLDIAKSLPEYTPGSPFKTQIDEREQKCNLKLAESRRMK
ncbi:MAG: hypothetical protein IJ087_01800 [Eggerthellaceae bacterium]|nr:hypothetical protein [Eggerthellaceae bacterium]